uniref:Cytochrome P450 76C4 n=1 Tax=Cajanus cajan TaxID=3821 RepID=A0A151TR13_CAJCA|nr:Cytochrome P450 76C4 [Cajanus cajan]
MKGDTKPYKIIEEFGCRMTGILKEWYANLGPVRQNMFHELGNTTAVLGAIHEEFIGDGSLTDRKIRPEFFEMKCCSLKMKDLDKHYLRMLKRFYLLNGLNDPSLKNTYVSSLPVEIQPKLARMAAAINKDFTALTMGWIHQMTQEAVDKLCRQHEYFSNMLRDKGKYARACRKEMDTFTCIILFLLTIIIMKALTSLLFLNRSKTNHKLPPGPIGLPIVGNLHQLGAKPHQSLAYLANTYGPIMSLKLGQITTIVMSSIEMAKEVFLMHDQFLLNSKIPDVMKGANHDEYNLPFIPVSHRWRDLGKLCNGLLFSNKNLVASEGLRYNKVKELLSDIYQNSLRLFVAGIDRLTSTVEWIMTKLLHNPNIMEKAKVELDRSKGVEESDIGKLPYLQAIMKETFKLHPTIPLLLPRKVEVKLEMHGYTIPKGAQVLVNVWAIGRDPDLWDNPCLFSPKRFLGSEIDYRGRSFELTPFGGGRRICPGLPLAIRLLFQLMLGLLINSFDWEPQGGAKP